MVVYSTLTDVLILLAILAAMFIFSSIFTVVAYSAFTFIFSLGGSKSLIKLMKKYEKSIKAILYGTFLFIGALFIFSYLKFEFADTILTQILLFVPKAFAAVLVLYAGYISYSLVNAFLKLSLEDLLGPGFIPTLSGQAMGVIVLAVFATISLDMLGMEAEIIKIFLVTCLMVVAIPLTILLGTIAWFFGSNLGLGYYIQFGGLNKGQRIKFEKFKGEIEKITPTHVRIKLKKGTRVIPTKEFVKKGWEEL